MFTNNGVFRPHVDFYVIAVLKISKKPSVTSTLVACKNAMHIFKYIIVTLQWIKVRIT